MPIIRKVFMSILRCIGCGFLGALVAGVVAVCVYFLFDWADAQLVFKTNVNAEQKAWAEFALMMVGLGGIFVGFILGGIYGAIRTLMNRKREEKGNGKS